MKRINSADPPLVVLSSSAVRNYVENLCILGKAVYQHCEIQESLIAKLDMWNINGVNIRGKDGRLSSAGQLHTWSSEHLNLDPIEIESLNHPEDATRMILERLGEAFGFDNSPFL